MGDGQQKAIRFWMVLPSAIQNIFFFFYSCILLQKKRGPLVDCCMESWYLMNAHLLIHRFVDYCIETLFYVDCCIES